MDADFGENTGLTFVEILSDYIQGSSLQYWLSGTYELNAFHFESYSTVRKIECPLLQSDRVEVLLTLPKYVKVVGSFLACPET